MLPDVVRPAVLEDKVAEGRGLLRCALCRVGVTVGFGLARSFEFAVLWYERP